MLMSIYILSHGLGRYNRSASGNMVSECESFHNFFEHWLVEQNSNLQELISASNNHHRRDRISNIIGNSTPQSPGHDDLVLNQLISQVIGHYEFYYTSKSRWAHQDVLSVLSPSWRTTLEDAFLWIGGWRPSMAFHLLYSKSGLQLETQLTDLIFGLGNGDLADLSVNQCNQINELQRKTISVEKAITDKMAKRQEKVADQSMVGLSHAVTELTGNGSELEEGRVESTLAVKLDGLEQVLQKADNLRLGTLKGVLEILSPIQAVHFLIAAAELHLRLHEWGLQKDAKSGHVRA